MISLFVWLFLVGASESRMMRNQRATSRSWKDHCAGDPCITENDSDGSLICKSGKCSNGSGGGTCSPSDVLHGRGKHLMVLLYTVYVILFQALIAIQKTCLTVVRRALTIHNINVRPRQNH